MLLVAQLERLAQPLAFNRASTDCYHASQQRGGAGLTAIGHPYRRAALCNQVMQFGTFSVEFEVIKIPGLLLLGVGRPGMDVGRVSAYTSAEFWGVSGNDGMMLHGGRSYRWAGQEGFCAGDIIGLRLDCSAGRLSFYKNGWLLGVPIQGDAGEEQQQQQQEEQRLWLPRGQTLSWAVAMGRTGAAVKLMRAPQLLMEMSTPSAVPFVPVPLAPQ